MLRLLKNADLKKRVISGPWSEHPAHPLHDRSVLAYWASRDDCCGVHLRSNACEILGIFSNPSQAGYFASVIIGKPILYSGDTPSAEQMREFIEGAARSLGGPIYYPLVNADFELLPQMLTAAVRKWSRSVSPVVSHKALNCGLSIRAGERIGSLCRRRLLRFRKSGASVRTVDSAEGIRCILSVESASWKRELQQDIISRDQHGMYSALLQSCRSLLRVAFLRDEAIAYRLDYCTGSRVYCMKWSFAEKHRNISPGFYLLVQDLSDCWQSAPIKQIDLYGSPDLLKDCICEEAGHQTRMDLAFPTQACVVDGLMKERLSHDRLLEEFRLNGKGVRNAYR